VSGLDFNPFSGLGGDPVMAAGDPNQAKRESFAQAALGIPGMPASPSAAGFPGVPTAEDIERQAEAVRFTKEIKTTGVFVKNWDLMVQEEAQDYCATYIRLMELANKGIYVPIDRQKHFIPAGPGNPHPRMILHLEWMEIELEKTDHMMKPEEANGSNIPSGL